MSGEYGIFETPPGDTGRPPTVVIADDQALVRGGFRLILKAAGIDAVAEAADGAQAVAAVLAHRPDVVLMDVRMPVMDGIEATKRILAAYPDSPAASESSGDAESPAEAAASGLRSASCCYQDGAPRIIILTTFDLDEYVYAALAAGASGFLLKDVTPEHLVAAVQLVRTGDALLAPSITRRLVERFATAPVTSGPANSGPLATGPGTSGRGRTIGAGRPWVSAGAASAGPAGTGPAGSAARPGTASDMSALTPREFEVLGLVARGLSNAEIASELVLSEATVKTHVARILTKLGLRDRVQAVVLAYETGLVSPSASSLQPHSAYLPQTRGRSPRGPRRHHRRNPSLAPGLGCLLRLRCFSDRRREPAGGAQRQQVVGTRHQHGRAAVEPHGDRPADFGHHGVLKVTEQHRRRDSDLAQPAESRRPRKFQLTELEPRRDRTAEHGGHGTVRPGRRPGAQPQADEFVKVPCRDQRIALAEVRVIGRPRVIVNSRGDEDESPSPPGVKEGQLERGPAAPTVPDHDRLPDATMIEQGPQVPNPGKRLRGARRAPEPPQVVPDHPVPLPQQRNERRPDPRIRPVSMHKDNRHPVTATVLHPQEAVGHGNANFHTAQHTRTRTAGPPLSQPAPRRATTASQPTRSEPSHSPEPPRRPQPPFPVFLPSSKPMTGTAPAQGATAGQASPPQFAAAKPPPSFHRHRRPLPLTPMKATRIDRTRQRHRRAI